jgi:hypothetical protein
MIAAAAGLLLRPAGWAAMAFMAVLAFAGAQTLRLDHAKGDAARARRAAAVCKADEGTLEGALARQNAAVAGEAAAAARAARAAQAAIDAGEARMAVARRRAARLMAARSGADACASAAALIAEGVK